MSTTKRKTEKLLEVDQLTMLLALQGRLEVEVNDLVAVLKVASNSINSSNVVTKSDELMNDISDSVTAIESLKDAIKEINKNDPNLITDRLGLDLNDMKNHTFAPEDIPF